MIKVLCIEPYPPRYLRAYCQSICILKCALCILLIIASNTAYGQKPSAQTASKQEPSQAELRQWRSNYHKAVTSLDTAAIFDNALLLRQYHNANFDSTYYYNDILIATALTVGNTEVYINAQKDNHFMDKQMYSKQESARNRMHKVRPYLLDNTLTLSSKFDIARVLANHFQQDGNLDSCIYYIKIAVRYSDQIGVDHRPKISANLELSKALGLVGRSAEAMEYLTNMERIIKVETYSAIQRIRFYQEICKGLLAIDDPSSAERYNRKAEVLIKANNYSTFHHHVDKLNGRIAAAKGNPIEALSHFESALQNLTKAKLSATKPGIWSHLAHQYYALGDQVKMRQYMDSLSNNFTNLFDRNKMHYHGHCVRYYLQNRDYKKAKASLDYVNNYNNKPTPERLSIAELNYQYYQKTGDQTNELAAYKRYTSLKDSLAELANGIVAKRISAEYEREKQELEISSLTKTTAAQDRALAIRNTALAIGGLMLLILAVLFYLLYRFYKQNQEQTVKIRKALEDNQMLIKEIHHRVNNNLQVVSSLLNLQERKVDDEATKEALKSSQTRVHTMSLIHKNLYQKDDVRNVNVKSYFQTLTENLTTTFAVHPTELNIDIDEVAIDIDALVPLGLIANELICNALKHGLKDKTAGILNVSLKEVGDQVALTVEDNGGNFVGNKLIVKEGSLGTRLIKALTSNIGGQITVKGGATTTITLAVDKAKISEIIN